MSNKLGPLPAPKGPGKDGPKEVNHDDDQIALEAIPPRISTIPKITYPYNKVTKYLNGSKLEFNTTPGHEYINIQHGNDLTRITLFADGNLEIIQEDGSRRDEVSGTFRQEVGGFYFTSSRDRFTTQDTYTSLTKQMSTFSADKKIILKSREIEIRGNVSLDKDVIIRGNLFVDGSVKINGSLDAAYELEVEEKYPEAPSANEESDDFDSDTLSKDESISTKPKEQS